MPNPIRFVSILVFLGTLGLSGCNHYAPNPSSVSVSAIYIDQAPPPRPRIVVPPAPNSIAVWIDGYWNWTGVQFVWVDGFWDPNPPQALHWVRDRWAQSNRGWYRQPGQWHAAPLGRRR